LSTSVYKLVLAATLAAVKGVYGTHSSTTKMVRTLLLPLAAVVFASVLYSHADARQLQNTIGQSPIQSLAASSILPAAKGQPCGAVCSTPAFFRSSLPGYSPKTLACAVDVAGSGFVAGYQLTTDATCTVVAGGSAVTSEEYSCICQDSSQTQGLEPGSEQGSCESSCNQSIDGMTGSAIRTDASSSGYVCLASEEIGYNNRFGYTVEENGSTACTYAADGAAKTDAAFSCFCLFSAPSTAALAQPQQALPTAG
jgi:hypothetical protein